MDFTILERKYTPVIQKLIEENKRFYGFNTQIKWSFFVNEDNCLFATNTANLELKINIVAVEFAYKNNQPIMVEFYILHEIRHIYQRCFASLLKTNKCPNISLAKVYEMEFANYCKIYNDRETYYSQQIEFEAFMFSYSVIKYKYGNIDYINYPAFYDEQNIEVEKYINQWLNIFKSKNL